MWRSSSRRSAAIAVCVGTVLALASSCSSNETVASEPTQSDVPESHAGLEFWTAVNLGGAYEVTPPGPVETLAAQSDAVVTGRFSDWCETRVFHGESPEDIVHYACLELTVAEVHTGEVEDRVLPVEFLYIPEPADSEAEALTAEVTPEEAGEEGLPPGNVVVFLVEKGPPDEAGVFRVLNSSGLWAASERGELDQPLREQPPHAQDPHVREALENASSVEELSAWLDRALDG